jgi:ATP-dependent Clp protease adaptor protein ClpS
MDPLALLALAGTGLGTWWLYRREQRAARRVDAGAAACAPDAEVALHVAIHEAKARRHRWLSSIHLLYGLLQDDEIVSAVDRVGGGAAALEDRALLALDAHAAHPPSSDAANEAGRALTYALAVAHPRGRRASCTDLWAGLVRAPSEATRIITETGTSAASVLFQLTHGDEPAIASDLAGDVHVVLRNDDYSTHDFVRAVLRDVFAMSPADAATCSQQTHDTGRAVIGRLAAPIARAKILEVRRRAREQRFPLWIGVEPA